MSGRVSMVMAETAGAETSSSGEGAHSPPAARQGKRARPWWPALALALLLAGCAAAPGTAPGAIDRAEAEAVLAAQARRWNEGDLRGFVESYWDGPRLTFLGAGGVTRGRADLLAKYERSYPTAAARGTLVFTVLDFVPLGSGHALLLGHYRLDRAEPDQGFFTLLLARQDGRVVILHDHTTQATK